MFCSAIDSTPSPLVNRTHAFPPTRRRLNRGGSPAEPREGLEPVHLGGEDEVALGETVYLVGEDRDLCPAPAEGDVRVVGFFLCQLAHPVHELQGLPEVIEAERPPQVMLLHDLPSGDLARELLQLLTLEGRHVAPARHARLARELAHPVLLSSSLLHVSYWSYGV